jgi:hypothetical protein
MEIMYAKSFSSNIRLHQNKQERRFLERFCTRFSTGVILHYELYIAFVDQ